MFQTKRSTFVSLFIISAVLFLIVLGVYAWKTSWRMKTARAQYQVVFLTNGQAYFGHVQDRNAQYLKLTDVYYLQKSIQPLQNAQTPPVSGEGGVKEKDRKAMEEGKDEATPSEPAQPELMLIKLGQELHGPQDRIYINRDQVMYIEDLRDDGKVVDAIKRYTPK